VVIQVSTTDSEAETGIERETDQCQRCGEEIYVDVDQCPECENNPGKVARRSAALLAGVGIFMLWIPVVGVPVLVLGLLSRLGVPYAGFGPTTHEFG